MPTIACMSRACWLPTAGNPQRPLGSLHKNEPLHLTFRRPILPGWERHLQMPGPDNAGPKWTVGGTVFEMRLGRPVSHPGPSTVENG